MLGPRLLILFAAWIVACGASARQPGFEEEATSRRRPPVAQGPVPVATPRAPEPPPRDPAVRLERARRALPLGEGTVVRDPEVGSPYVLALRALSGGGALLGLVDVRVAPGVLIGRHDFTLGPMALTDAFVLRTSTGEPAILAALDGVDGASACGWWLSARHPRFLCAPKVARDSDFDQVGGVLLESWETDFPPPPLAEPTRTGRMIRLTPAGRWAEIDGFRCLGRPLAEVVEEAGSRGVRRWQRDMVGRLVRVARHQSDTFHDERAEALLEDAIAVDACDAGPWRLLGRLRFQSGQTESATPALAAAVALDSHEAAPLVDLADAVVGLDVSTPAGTEAWDTTRVLLARSSATRRLAEGAPGPKALARSLYLAYLERTAESADRHRTRRRRVEQQLQLLP